VLVFWGAGVLPTRTSASLACEDTGIPRCSRDDCTSGTRGVCDYKEETMKHISLIRLLLTFTMLMGVCLASAATSGEVDSIGALSTYAIPFLAALICFFIGRYLKINVEVQKIIPVLTAIVSACFNTEKETQAAIKPEGIANYDEYRAVIAATKVETALNASGQGTLKKVFGTAIDAVKFVFPLIKPVVKLLK